MWNKAKKKMTVVEITENKIRWLRVTGGQKGRRVLLWQEKDNCADTVRQLIPVFSGAGQNSGSEVLLVIPRREVILKQVALPGGEDEEIRRMIELQIPQWGPYSREEMVFDYFVLMQNPDLSVVVMVVLCPAARMKAIAEFVERAEAGTPEMILSSQSLAGWVNCRFAGEQGCVALAVFNGEDSEICFCREGKLLFSRPVDAGPGPGKEELIEQVRISLELYHRENFGGAVEKVLVLGGEAAISAGQEQLSAELGVPVIILSEKERGLPEGENCSEDSASRIPERLWGAILPLVKSRLNLFPRDFQARQTKRACRRLARQCVALFLLAWLFAVSPLAAKIYSAGENIAALDRELKVLRPKVNSARRQIAVRQALAEARRQNVPVAEILGGIYALTPDNIFYRSIAKDQEGAVTLEGVAPDSGAVYSLQGRLTGSQAFSESALLFVTQRPAAESTEFEFKITCQLAAKDEDAKKDSQN